MLLSKESCAFLKHFKYFFAELIFLFLNIYATTNKEFFFNKNLSSQTSLKLTYLKLVVLCCLFITSKQKI